MTGRASYRYTATNCGASLTRFGFFTFAGPNKEPAAIPAVSATPGLRETIAATMAPSISSASWCARLSGSAAPISPASFSICASTTFLCRIAIARNCFWSLSCSATALMKGQP